jgi:hypothetical protein
VTTIVVGELSRSFDPAVSEWRNPLFIEYPRLWRGRRRPELKHLSRGRKRNHRDSVSKRRAKAEQPKPISQDIGVAGQTIWDWTRVAELSGKAGQRT